MLSIAFIMAFVVAAVSMILGIFIYSEVSDGIGSSFGDPILIANGTAGGIVTDSPMYACEPTDTDLSGLTGKISLIDKTTGSPISSVEIDDSSGGCAGLTVDPTTGVFYVIGGTYNLETVNPTTGVSNYLGGDFNSEWWGSGSPSCPFLDYCSTMAFDITGNLFISSWNTTVTEIHKVDKSNADTLSSCEISFSKHRLAFNYDNDKMYRLVESPLNLEVIDPNTCATSETVSITGTNSFGANGKPLSFSYNTADGLFYLMVKYSEVSDPFNDDGRTDYYSLQTDGTATLITEGVYNPHLIEPWWCSGCYDLSNWYNGLAFTPIDTGEGSPPIYEDTTPEAFTQADSIAFTILAIIPITLFFALFTILSPRVDGEI